MKMFEGSDGSEEDISKFEINKEFARRYEHNKKREDLQRLEELKKRGIVEDSSDSESSDESAEDELFNSKKDLEFLSALIKVKNQQPELKNEEAKLFDSENEADGENRKQGKQGKKEKQMYLKDVTARHLIEEGPEFEEKEVILGVKSYSEEQEELRRAFLDAADAALDNDDGGELLKEKVSKTMANEDDDDAGEVQKKLEEFFGNDDNLDGNEMFLKEYFKNRMWVEDSGEGKGKMALDEDVLDFSEDEEEIEKQEDYEREYNFRFEENAGDRVLGHSRFVEGSVRKKTNARKVQRKRREERMAQAEFERKEELKHLKNLKKKEMNEKLRKIKDTAGIGENWVCPLDEDGLEEEFDPDEYDRKMKEAFNDDYYDADDADPEFASDGDEDGDEVEKPDFDKEDELLGLPKGDGFFAVRERNLKRRAENEGTHGQIEDKESLTEDSNQKKKQKVSKLEKEVLDKELEEYYKLDYEDTIGDLKTRFKYKGVGAKRYGLNTEDIFMLDDKVLNQYVSLKKIAPYREEWKVPRKQMHKRKQEIKLLLRAKRLNDQKTGKNNRRIENNKSFTVEASTEHEKAQAESPNGDVSKQSRGKRRRKNQANLKLSQSRLMAYGKIQSKSKSKKKH